MKKLQVFGDPNFGLGAFLWAGRRADVPPGVSDLQRLRGVRGGRRRLHEGRADSLWGVWGQRGLNMTITITVVHYNN